MSGYIDSYNIIIDSLSELESSDIESFNKVKDYLDVFCNGLDELYSPKNFIGEQILAKYDSKKRLIYVKLLCFSVLLKNTKQNTFFNITRNVKKISFAGVDGEGVEITFCISVDQIANL